MTGEILTLHVGQCGNQVGQQYWSQIAKEHGIGKDGQSVEPDDPNTFREDDTNPFFRRNAQDRYTPRALMFDLEPKVINDAFNNYPGFFDPRNSWVSEEKYGAGNSWAKGYQEGQKSEEHFLNMIDKELDSTENFEGFQLFHSVAGGTGSGLGSNLLETLADRYSKNILTTYSVFPTDQSEVVVQPYNTVLTLRRLAEESDASVIFDNNALLSLSSRVFRGQQIDFSNSNQLIAATLSSVTNSLRFPSYMYTSLQSLVSTLVPSPDLHFLTPSFTPFTSDYVAHEKEYRQNTAYDVLLDLIDGNNSLVSNKNNKPVYFNTFSTLIGTLDRSDITRAISKLQTRLHFAPWSSSVIHVNCGRRSPYLTNKNIGGDYVNGMMLSNSTGVIPLLENACHSFDKIFAKRAFLNTFTQSGMLSDDDSEFIDSRAVAQNIIDQYVTAEETDYLDDILLDDENMTGVLEDVGGQQVDHEGDNIIV
ncbi:gamma-tubulin KNAG_0B02710 [Huiozyma naganishii CBS 8797]|uniref:Tubulin gamma chain n=1 Tax=Huiozyma naganishii (strain ATCC MYA-139 / BCRC 22969 / CBS 8797 / KCTC 17520 / NBRC 10181 / NCYC 3082 / Yp74L-3) TaxID=1071383 RepID=J7S3G5_HUIN7|nr:hypothetical protein KNAG_0B02710 [Kazachstania naganishii CBS 8797]CCK68714.1 hypothetical protein KNAG_0B02710 [Kazachstania naganishii CBS 8797]